MSHQSLRTDIRKKIMVAMSGGVDSSVAAALFKRAGFNVVGVFMKFWLGERNRCCSPEAEKRARQVAAKLGIPFYVFNFEKEFKKRIVDYFLKESKAGRTPNPCVVCNKEIKFGLLLEKALAMGADYVATGHYTKLDMRCPTGLLIAKDKEKDQSYFLWQLNQEQLKHILFPLGDYTKKEVRKLAKKFNLPTAATPDSEELCFVPTTINDFLAKYIKPKPGPIACACYEPAQTVQATSVHKHRGLAFYTIGQRKGVGLAQGPYWVLAKTLKRNILIVTQNEKDLLKKELFFKNANWIAGKEPKFPLRVRAKIRYRSKLASAVIHKLKTNNYKLIFDRPQRAITPGQSVVFYRGQELLGGGIILY